MLKEQGGFLLGPAAPLPGEREIPEDETALLSQVLSDASIG